MAKQILFDEKARKAIKQGITILAKAVGATLGPRGRAVVIEGGYGAPKVTFDGVTVAKEITLEDKYENLGAELIKQAADKTNDVVGDGTTTSIVLAEAIIEEGEKALASKDVNVIQLAEELKESAQLFIQKLERQKEEVKEQQKLEEVASLSAKDKEIGKLIAEVVNKVGKDGVVAIEDSNTISNSYEVVEGMQLENGFISQYMITNPDKMEAVLEEPAILVTDRKITHIQELVPILEKVVQSGKKELVIFADDVDGEALTTLVVNKMRGIFTAVAVKAPGFGDRKREILKDIAVITNANFISDEVGIKLEAMEMHQLGSARRVIATKDSTTIVDGKGNEEDIQDRIKQLKAQIEKTESPFDKEKLKERLGKLSGGVAVIKVGAPTESAQKELKQRVEDAVAATRAAMEEGIVPGGGMALYYAGLELSNYQSVANMILVAASKAPIRKIIENSGKNPEEIIAKLPTESCWKGFDAKKQEISDLRANGILDPLKVTKTALLNAVSVAANYLVIGAAVTNVPVKTNEPSE